MVNANIYYQDNMVEMQMLTGLYNPDHRIKILTEADKLPAFEDKYNALITMQTSESSAAQLVGGASLRKIDYMRQNDKEPPETEVTPPPPPPTARKCSTCSGPLPLPKFNRPKPQKSTDRRTGTVINATRSSSRI